ncbi:MAG: hypothetical protein GY770_09755 [Aestuariibacter sp.]|nr:hypothetical protein [Aestuariibacter sp.]
MRLVFVLHLVCAACQASADSCSGCGNIVLWPARRVAVGCF